LERRKPNRIADVGHPEPWVRFLDICEEEGRKLNWVSRRMGISYTTLYGLFHGYPGCVATPPRRAMIAGLLNVSEDEIWGVLQGQLALEDDDAGEPDAALAKVG